MMINELLGDYYMGEEVKSKVLDLSLDESLRSMIYSRSGGRGEGFATFLHLNKFSMPFKTKIISQKEFLEWANSLEVLGGMARSYKAIIKHPPLPSTIFAPKDWQDRIENLNSEKNLTTLFNLAKQKQDIVDDLHVPTKNIFDFGEKNIVSWTNYPIDLNKQGSVNTLSREILKVRSESFFIEPSSHIDLNELRLSFLNVLFYEKFYNLYVGLNDFEKDLVCKMTIMSDMSDILLAWETIKNNHPEIL